MYHQCEERYQFDLCLYIPLASKVKNIENTFAPFQATIMLLVSVLQHASL